MKEARYGQPSRGERRKTVHPAQRHGIWIECKLVRIGEDAADAEITFAVNANGDPVAGAEFEVLINGNLLNTDEGPLVTDQRGFVDLKVTDILLQRHRKTGKFGFFVDAKETNPPRGEEPLSGHTFVEAVETQETGTRQARSSSRRGRGREDDDRTEPRYPTQNRPGTSSTRPSSPPNPQSGGMMTPRKVGGVEAVAQRTDDGGIAIITSVTDDNGQLYGNTNFSLIKSGKRYSATTDDDGYHTWEIPPEEPEGEVIVMAPGVAAVTVEPPPVK